MSLIIDFDGEYVYEPDSRALKTSSSNVYKANIELSLPLGEWVYSPNSGHGLKKYLKSGAREETVESLNKEARLYLDKYEAEIVDQAISRGKSETKIKIQE